jgi:uncharacterized membrane protein
LKGLAIVLPPVLTLWIFQWVAFGLYNNVLTPISNVVRYIIAHNISDARSTDQFHVPPASLPELEHCERKYRVTPEFQQVVRDRDVAQGDERIRLDAEIKNRLPTEAWVPFGDIAVPYKDFLDVASRTRPSEMPTATVGIYMELTTIRYFGSLFLFNSLAVLIAIVLLYFMGRLVTARIGAYFVGKFETLVMAKVPLVSNVYSSVKQVTDFLFKERVIEYNRVVALEYPRRGIWTMGFATGDGLLEVTAAAGEPLVSVLIPTSPMPLTGFTISLPRNDVIDLNVTIDQAFQFCLSCGVLVPPQQKVTPELIQEALAKKLAGAQQTQVLSGQASPVADRPNVLGPTSNGDVS